MDNHCSNLIKQVIVTTNEALVLSLNGSQSDSPTNDQTIDENSINRPNERSIMNAVTVDKLTIEDLTQKFGSETDLSNFLDLIEFNRSLPFTKNQETFENTDDRDKSNDKFEIKIRIKDESNLKIGSIQLLCSEEMFELHCGDTNEYISTVYCDFIDKLDQQFVIHYGHHSQIDRSIKKSSFAIKSSLKKSLNIIFPKFNSSLKDTIWIFAIKLNLIECKSMNFDNSQSSFSSMGNVLPLMQMFQQIKSDHKMNDLNNQFSQFFSNTSKDQINSDQLNQQANLIQTSNLPNLVSQMLLSNNSKNNSQNQIDFKQSTHQNAQYLNQKSFKPKVIHRSKLRVRNSSNNLILKKLVNLEQKMNSINQKLSELQLDLNRTK